MFEFDVVFDSDDHKVKTFVVFRRVAELETIGGLATGDQRAETSCKGVAGKVAKPSCQNRPCGWCWCLGVVIMRRDKFKAEHMYMYHELTRDSIAKSDMT